MKLRRIKTHAGLRVQAEVGGAWISLERVSDLSEIGPRLANDLASNLISVLQLSLEEQEKLLDALQNLPPEGCGSATECLPFEPASFRDFMLYEKHVIDSSRGFVKRFMPKLHPFVKALETLTGKPFGKFKPDPLWYKQPIYYLSNHLNFGVSGDEVAWPSYTRALDYELELGAVLSKPLFNASKNEARDAIGGFVILNDCSARDVQKAEMDSGFGPQKAKHFASTMSAEVVTADVVLPHINDLSGSVSINGVTVSQCHTKGMHFDLSEAIAFASKDEQLHPGELFGTGTIPGGSGMETGHWLSPGDTLSLSIDRIGVLTNTIKNGAQ